MQVSTITGIGFSLTGAGGQTERIPTRIIAPILYRLALRKNARVVFQNEEDRAEFLRRRLVSAASTRVFPGSGIDMEVHQPSARRKTASRIRFVLLGRMIRPKGIFEFVEAARIVHSAMPNVCEFVLAGPIDHQNPDRLTLEQLEAWTAEGVVSWIGRTPSAVEAYCDADVAVLPSYHEGMPRAVVEAAAMGLPVITTQTRGCRDTVIDGVTGRLVPVGNVPALAESMLELAGDANLRETMGRKGRDFVKDRFSVGRILESVLALYESELALRGLALNHRDSGLASEDASTTEMTATLPKPGQMDER
jgi:glycosyltransferase involved in cell wall biosynthesis